MEWPWNRTPPAPTESPPDPWGGATHQWGAAPPKPDSGGENETWGDRAKTAGHAAQRTAKGFWNGSSLHWPTPTTGGPSGPSFGEKLWSGDSSLNW